jgi:hypothetical protein
MSVFRDHVDQKVGNEKSVSFFKGLVRGLLHQEKVVDMPLERTLFFLTFRDRIKGFNAVARENLSSLFPITI